MKLPKLTASRMGPALLQGLCKWLPRRWLYNLSDWRSEIIVSADSRAITRANLSVVLGLPQNHAHVDKAHRQLLRNVARGYIDLFHSLALGPDHIFDAVRFDASLDEIIEAYQRTGKGLLLVGTHTSSFDLLLMALREHFPDIQVLTQSIPQGSSRVMNDIREQFGLDVTPLSTKSLKAALKRLRAGGVVAVAADVPIDGIDSLTFFGHKCRLPSGYIRMAIKTGALICVGASHILESGHYRATGSLVPRPAGLQVDEIAWAQAVVLQVEHLIREKPEEWFMPYAVWSDSTLSSKSTILPSHRLFKASQA